jgi:gluconolactonase
MLQDVLRTRISLFRGTKRRSGTRAWFLRLVRYCAVALAGAFNVTNAGAATVEKWHPSLDRLISTQAQLVTIKIQRDGFFEGPSWIRGRQGYLVVSAIPDNSLLKIDGRGQASVLLSDVVQGSFSDVIHDTLYTNRDLRGSNGTVAEGSGKLVLALFGGRGIAELDLRTGKRRLLASGLRSPRFRFPNDLTFGPGGDLYFSAHEGIFRLHRGRLSLFYKAAANGLAFTPDKRFLYATDGPTRILKIALKSDGSAGASDTFLETGGEPAKGEFLDGLKVDDEGNLWAVAPGGIWIINKVGIRLGRILAPTVQMPTGSHHRFTNLAFGGNDGATLYLTAPGGIYSIRLERPIWVPHGQNQRQRN